MDIQVELSGPLFDGGFARGMDVITAEAVDVVAGLALERVHYFLDAQIRNPTPYYETQIARQRAGLFEVIHDRGIVYGPWLEGTSRRNQTTKFKGYASFRKARDVVEGRAPEMAGQVVARNMHRLGG